MAAITLDRRRQEPMTGKTMAVGGRVARHRATANSWCWSAPRAAASPRCCAWSPGWRRSPTARCGSAGRVVNDVEPADRDIAMVFQNYALYPHMSVRQNLAYGLKNRGMAEAEIARRVDEAAQILEIGQFLDRKPRAAFGRPAPARRHGPRHRARAGGVPVRRAAVEPRRQAARSRCAARSGSCRGGSAPPRSMSPTIRSRR